MYENTQTKKLTKALGLRDELVRRASLTGTDPAPEAARLQTLIEQIEVTSQQFDRQVDLYWVLAETRRGLANGNDKAIKPLMDPLWKDIICQFRDGTVANDLLKILCQKIQRLLLPTFPVSRKNPAFPKEVRLYEDSYALLGEYFGWLIDLLQIVHFTPNRIRCTLAELQEQAGQFNTLAGQGRQFAETLREIQLTQLLLHRQLDQAIGAARGRMLIYRREARRVTKLSL
ncbi:hypothetical protein [Spirosoma flavum]|uniref:Uncharacterized protein n=1 Tax=Spirosoma flavum TaxID=2048557 RepID=A0ABW6ASQ5_9BACT